MKTVTLTASEIETLEYYLMTNPCSSHCLHNYKRIECGDRRCRLERDTESIRKKLGLGE